MRFACLFALLILPVSCSRSDSETPVSVTETTSPVQNDVAPMQKPGEPAAEMREEPPTQDDETEGRVYTMTELLEGIEKRQFKYGERAKVRGVIGRIDLYDSYIDESESSEIYLESGIPETSIEQEELGSCSFDSPDQLFDLAVGQTVVIEGEVGSSLLFMLEDCKIVSAGERLRAAIPKLTRQLIEDYAQEDSELAKTLTQLNDDLNIDARTGTWDNEFLEVKVTIDEEQIAEISQQEFDALAKLPILSRLVLYAVADDAAKQLAKLPYCEELFIHCENLTTDGLNELLSIPGIQELRLFSTDGLDASALNTLQKVPGIWTLALFGEDPDESFQSSAEEALQALRYVPELRYLELIRIGGTDTELSELAKLKHLRRLEINGCSLNGSSLKYLSDSKNFWFASLSGESVTDELGEGLKELNSLRILELDGTSVTGKVGVGFSSFQNLEQLEVTSSSVDSRIGSHLEPCVSLKRLNLRDNPIDDNFVIPAEQLSQLEWVILSDTTVGDQTCEQLSQLPKLRTLWLDSTKVTDAGLKALADRVDLPLKELSLRKTEVSEAGVANLLKLKSLKKVTISDTVVVSDELKNRYKDQGVTLSVVSY